MKPIHLVPAFAKTERAKTQIVELQQVVRAFLQTRPYRMASKLTNDRPMEVWNGPVEVWRFELTASIPDEIPVRIGEILHNLRSPLDQVLCAIATKAGKTEDGVAWPFGETAAKFETELRKQKKLPVATLDLIRSIKPYVGGTDILWALHLRNKRDKHRVGLVPVMLPALIRMRRLVFWRGLGLVLGCKTGKHLALAKAITEQNLVETGKPLAIYDSSPGFLEFGDANTPGDTSLEFLTTTPGAKFETDFEPCLSIALDEVGCRDKPVVIVLNELRQLVEGILLAFEKRFF